VQAQVRSEIQNLKKLHSWWLMVKGCNVDICLEDPGQDVDVYLTTDLRTIHCIRLNETIRIVSARKADKRERASYEEFRHA
jgi:hypothetical protein